MDVVVSSRHCEISERFREHVEDKLVRLEKHDHRIIRVEVLLERERNARQPERQVRVELTAKSKGPILRAEAAAEGTEELVEHQVGPVTVDGDGPLVVREKTHAATAITLEQALYEMELVG